MTHVMLLCRTTLSGTGSNVMVSGTGIGGFFVQILLGS